jgi:hypothetical protein
MGYGCVNSFVAKPGCEIHKAFLRNDFETSKTLV